VSDCDHGVMADHCEKINGRRIWTCSGCGKRGEWGDSWSYYGAVECRDCGATPIEWVACSERCMLPIPEGGRTRTRSKSGAVRGCTKCGKAGHYAPTCGVRP
jgi:hypothetical protein